MSTPIRLAALLCVLAFAPAPLLAQEEAEPEPAPAKAETETTDRWIAFSETLAKHRSGSGEPSSEPGQPLTPQRQQP